VEAEVGKGDEVAVYCSMSNSNTASSASSGSRKVAISDQCQSYMEPNAAGSFAENGKLGDQRGMFHQCCEACIRMASLA
jgi:hypothetical protein